MDISDFTVEQVGTLDNLHNILELAIVFDKGLIPRNPAEHDYNFAAQQIAKTVFESIDQHIVKIALDEIEKMPEDAATKTANQMTHIKYENSEEFEAVESLIRNTIAPRHRKKIEVLAKRKVALTGGILDELSRNAQSLN